MRLIESDSFPFEFLSRLAERESWRKEVHRPIYHVHKWWAKRLGSVFRGLLLGAALPADADLAREFYRSRQHHGQTVFDPFMGSGTTIGEAHKLGFTAIGRDINPVAVEAVKSALGPMDRARLESAFRDLANGVGRELRELYRSVDSHGEPCEVLYFFWVMQAPCGRCQHPVDLFPSWIVARNAYPDRHPEVQFLCPSCGDVFPGVQDQGEAICRSCEARFDPGQGVAKGAKAVCRECGETFKVQGAIAATGKRPAYRLYGKLVLTKRGDKEYLRASKEDFAAYQECAGILHLAVARGEMNPPPTLALKQGYNTRQAMNYGFVHWSDFFNHRQLFALGRLRKGIDQIEDPSTRSALLTLFSGVLEFNNLFASYKGEGTGAVRHMFSHHILKPERTPIEANVWGTSKSSGSFSNLFRSRLLSAIDYRAAPTEVNGNLKAPGRICSPAFSGLIQDHCPDDGVYAERGIYLSCGDSSNSGLAPGSVDLVVTDPPFFDNVHYSELADFFQAWRPDSSGACATTRHPAEVQDSDSGEFSQKLQSVFCECARVLREDGLLIFTYHHSRDEGWSSLAAALLGSGFAVVNAHPVKAEMSVATPKSQAKDPIQLDIIVVCRKACAGATLGPTAFDAIEAARAKVSRLEAAGFDLSRNDRKIVFNGQLLTVPRGSDASLEFADEVEKAVESSRPKATSLGERGGQMMMFD